MENLRNRTYHILRESEDFFKADMIYLAKGSFWQAFGQILSGLFSFGLIIVFANLLPKETYGLYRYILSLAGILGMFTLTGMNRSVIQAVSAGYDGALKTAVKYQLKWNLLMAAAFLILSGYYFYKDNPEIALSLAVMAIFTPLTFALNTYGAYLEGKRQFRLNNIFGVISVCIYVVGMMLTVFLGGGPVWLILTYSLVTFATTLFFHFQTLKLVKPENDMAGDTLNYGRKLTFIGFIAPVASQIDNIIVTHFWGATALALYSLALAMPSRLITFIKSLVDIGYPKLVDKNVQEINSVYLRRIFQGIALGTASAGLYIAAVPYVFKYLMPGYMDSILYSQIIAISLVVAMPNRYHSSIFESQKLAQLILINSIIHNIFRIAIYVVLGIWGGILGLAIAHVLNSVISLFINMMMWRFGRKRFS